MTTKEHPLAGVSCPGRGAGFSLRRLTRVNLALLMLTILGSTLAETHTYSAHGVTVTINYAYNATTNKVDWSFTCGAAPGYGSAVQIYETTGSGGAAGGLIISGNNASGGTGTGSNSFNTTQGQWYKIYAYVVSSPGNVPSPADYNPTYWQVPEELPFYADFRVPANTGTQPVKVYFYQAGVEISSLTVSPGSAAQTVHLGGIDEGLVTVVYSYGNLVRAEGGTLSFEPDKEFEHAGGGAAVNDAEPPDPYGLLPMRNSTGVTPANEPLEPPAPETPQDDPTPTDAPTPQGATTKPTRGAVGIPFGTPSGATGATKEDLETATNALANALDEIDTNRQASDDATLDAIDKTNTALGENSAAEIAALNSLREELVTGRNKQLSATEKTNTAITGLRDDVRTGNTALTGIAATLGELELNNRPPEAETTAAWQTMVLQLGTDLQDSVTAAVDVPPELGAVADDDPDMGAGLPSILLPGSPTVAVSLNPLQNEKVQDLANLLRALIGWSVIFTLVAWTYMQIPKWMILALQGGSGITAWRAATGALPVAGIAVATALILAVGALILTFPTIMHAYADPLMMGSAGTALVDVRTIITSYGGPSAGQMIALLDSVCPVALCMTAAFNFIILVIGGRALVAGMIAFAKVLAS